MVISGGENVYPAEIEDVLHDHPDIVEAAVVGVPDARWGEACAAFVVLRDGATASAEDLAEHCGARLARFKVPKTIEVAEALPRTASGKLLRRELA